jgi:hypothetical protein
MFKWYKEWKDNIQRQEEYQAHQQKIYLYGAQKLEDVNIGTMSHPKLTDSQREWLPSLNYLDFKREAIKIIKSYKPYDHRSYSEIEIIVILDEFLDWWWLVPIRDDVSKKWTKEDLDLENAREEFVERCFRLAYSKGFIPGTPYLTKEEHIKHLKRKWGEFDYNDLILSKMMGRLYDEYGEAQVKVIKKLINPSDEKY